MPFICESFNKFLKFQIVNGTTHDMIFRLIWFVAYLYSFLQSFVFPPIFHMPDDTNINGIPQTNLFVAAFFSRIRFILFTWISKCHCYHFNFCLQVSAHQDKKEAWQICVSILLISNLRVQFCPCRCDINSFFSIDVDFDVTIES